jgi:hypothetical protein
MHREGTMRLATALDEIEVLSHPKVEKNPAYANLVLISRVLMSLGGFSPVPLNLIEQLYAADFIFLQDLYLQINTGEGQLNFLDEIIETECPQCKHHFLISLSDLTESD